MWGVSLRALEKGSWRMRVCLSLEFLDSGDAICVYGKVLVKTRPDGLNCLISSYHHFLSQVEPDGDLHSSGTCGSGRG